MTVTKNDLVQEIMGKSEFNRVQASRFVDDFFEVISKELESGGEVKVAGFGNFILRDKKERFGRNPKTKEEFPIAARRVVSFHTSNLLKDRIKKLQTKLKESHSHAKSKVVSSRGESSSAE